MNNELLKMINCLLKEKCDDTGILPNFDTLSCRENIFIPQYYIWSITGIKKGNKIFIYILIDKKIQRSEL